MRTWRNCLQASQPNGSQSLINYYYYLIITQWHSRRAVGIDDAGMFDKMIANEQKIDKDGYAVVVAQLLAELVEVHDCRLAIIKLRRFKASLLR